MPPLLSVLLTAFDQEPYVGEALESALAQRREFPVEVVVGVDASGDGTAEVVRRFERARPEVVRALVHARRLGLHGNFAAAYAAARGRYLALLEGDDLWTDPEKLARQVALLEARPEVVLCGHTVEVVTADGRRLGTIPEAPYGSAPSRREFVARLCDFHTSSLVFRNVFGGALPEPLRDERTRVVDLPLKLALVARGEVAFLPETMSRFRRRPDSASSAIDDEGWRDVALRALRDARPALSGELRAAADERLVELLVGGALSPRRPRPERLRLAAAALARRPLAAARALARGAYAGLPEGAKRAYRGARGLAGSGGGGAAT
jgi:glycosyltransferase involved in cell wall biosynthesis